MNIVIFSHGFGVRKDGRGLFTAIARSLPDIEPIMFDYNQFDEATKTMTVASLDEHVEKLRQVYAETRANDPDATIDLVCHSQGCVIAAMAQLDGIRKTIFLAPPDQRFGFGRIQEKVQALLKRPGAVQNAGGSLRYPRRDGSTTIIPPSYWKSRDGVDTIKLYQQLADKTQLIIVQATNDEVIGMTDFSELPDTVKVTQMDTGHDFEGEDRERVAGIVAKEIGTSEDNNYAVTDELAKIIWDYHHMNQPLEKCDVIFALGSSDLRVGEYAAKLFLEGYANYLVISGGFGRITKDRFNKPEAEIFADIAIQMGVPQEKIIIETEATNTGQNITLTHELLERRGLHPSSLIVVTKPYMERRTYATFKKQWPNEDTKLIVSSPPIKYDDYFTEELPKDFVINIMVGDLQRIKEYPKLGFQIEQEIPEEVWHAYQQLVTAGFDQALMKEAN